MNNSSHSLSSDTTFLSNTDTSSSQRGLSPLPELPAPEGLSLSLSFGDYLSRIRQLKLVADTIIANAIPHTTSASACLSSAWEATFLLLCDADCKFSLTELNTLSGVIQRLIAAYNTLQSIEVKNSLHQVKLEELELKAQKLKESLRSFQSKALPSLSDETIDQIIDQLKLI